MTEEEEHICPSCNGSGEGAYEGYTCSSCSGSGVEYCGGTADDDYEPEEEEDFAGH